MVLAMLAACVLLEEPISSRGRISVLTVAGLVVEPPSLGPGDAVDVSAVVVDPEARGYTLLVWSCVPLELPHAEATPMTDPIPCLEDRAGVAPFLYRSGEPAPPRWTLASPVVEPTSGEPTLATGLVMALACAEPWCPARLQTIEALLAASDPDLALVRDLLQQPATWIGPAPRADLHFAVRRFEVSDGPLPERDANPVVVGPVGIPLDEGPVQLVFTVADADHDVIIAHAYATHGFVDGPGLVAERRLVLQYTPPLDHDRDHVVVAFEELDGPGSAVYEAIAER